MKSSPPNKTPAPSKKKTGLDNVIEMTKPVAEPDKISLNKSNIRYLLERRLARSIETLTRDAGGETLPVRIVQSGVDHEISFTPTRRDNPFCKLIHESKQGLEKCSLCYLSHLSRAEIHNDLYAYRCHAGLTNVIIPVVVKNSTVGGVVVGRVFIDAPRKTEREKILSAVKPFCPDRQTAEKALDKVPVLKETDLHLAGLVARNLVKTEGPMLLETQVFDPSAKRGEKAQAAIVNFPLQPKPEKTYGVYIRHQRICKEIVEILERQFASPITAAKLANAFKITPNYLGVIFRKTMGLTVNEYLMRLRVQKAQGFLQRADVNIKEVAYRVGFADANYFAAVFKKITGLTPSHWRAKLDAEMLTVSEARAES